MSYAKCLVNKVIYRNTTRLLNSVCKPSTGEALDIYQIISVTNGSLDKRSSAGGKT